MKHTDISAILRAPETFVGQTLTICGWVRTTRDSKTLGFVELNDGTCPGNLQVVVDTGAGGDKVSTLFKIGAGVMVRADAVMNEERGAVDFLMKEYTILGDCPSDYPLQKKRQTLDFLRGMPHLRVRTNTIANVMRIRSALAYASHRFFQENGYVYVHTPEITGNDCEGGGEVFRVTTQPWNAKADSEAEYDAGDFFGQKAYLTVSGQLEGEVAAMALGKIYTFGPVFRAENSNTTRHLNEFWQVEPEVAFAELPDIIEIAESYIKYMIRFVLDNYPEELRFFDKFYEPGLIDKLHNVVDNDFAVVEYAEAVEILRGVTDQVFEFTPEWGAELQSEHERYLTEKVFKRPVFVINYPKDIKAFYMKQNPDGRTVAATDLLVPGIGEIIGCSERETDYDKVVEAMRKRGMDPANYQQYLDLRKYGTVPHSGFGIGFDRMVMYVTGMSNIRDVMLFPRTPKSIR